MKKVKVQLRPIVSNINLPTVIKTAILPREQIERLFIATQVGEIIYIGEGGRPETFLDIKSRILELGKNGGYDERGLLGLAFHPRFNSNGLFYIHYSVAGSQGPGALTSSFTPDPCNPKTLNLKWINREINYDHIDTIEEWNIQPNSLPQLRRKLLNIRRPFMNHNGVNSLNFSPENGKLIFTNGDGGSGFDPFNLAQNDMEIAGKIIEIDIDININNINPPTITRFNEIPKEISEMLAVIVKGIRNTTGITYQKTNNQYTKYVGNVGQDLVESIFSFTDYKTIPVSQLGSIQSNGLINLGWRGWEGDFPTSIPSICKENSNSLEVITVYYEEALRTSKTRLMPLTTYYHFDPRTNSFEENALTGVQLYMGLAIPELTGKIVFSDYVNSNYKPDRGVLAYTNVRTECKINEFSVIEVDYNSNSDPAYYVSLGTNANQTKLYLGVHVTAKVADNNGGTVFEIIPTQY